MPALRAKVFYTSKKFICGAFVNLKIITPDCVRGYKYVAPTELLLK